MIPFDERKSLLLDLALILSESEDLEEQFFGEAWKRALESEIFDDTETDD